jgi:hypothetical protein
MAARRHLPPDRLITALALLAGLALAPARSRAELPPLPHPAPLEMLRSSAVTGEVCRPDVGTLCLGGGRFRVRASWRTSQGLEGPAMPVRLGEDSGNFWFFDADNVEMVVKVLDGCALNQRYWVFASGLTNVRVDLSVEDLWAGATWSRTNPQGKAFTPIQDTAALATCSAVPPAIAPDLSREVVAADLRFEWQARRATARLTVAPGPSRGLSLDVGDLEVDFVRDSRGALEFAVAGGRLDVRLRPGDGPREVTVGYHFAERSRGTGLLAGGSTYLWPDGCGNLYPCQPDPPAGVRATVHVEDLGGEVAVVPGAIPNVGPSYMPAFAVGAYTQHFLGTTSGGTDLLVWSLPGGEAAALAGTDDLVATFDFFERTLGPYPFGGRAGAVPVSWPAPAGGGIESHPFWHVAAGDVDDDLLHAHEAAHGWFGNGVRLRCWEDFVLSEGVATYLTARAVEAVDGQGAAAAVWADYSQRLDQAIHQGDTIAWPQGCNAIDPTSHPLWSWIPYLKGALFLREVESAAGRASFDAALRAFHAAHRGEAAGVSDLLVAIHTGTGFDPRPLAEAWLRNPGRPDG